MQSLSTLPSQAGPFSTDQKEYLQGFMAGVLASGQFSLSATTAADPRLSDLRPSTPPEAAVHGTALSDLCKEELWKHQENPLDSWERLLAHADADRFPDAENTYRFKTHGLFYVSPAQDSFMMRLRIPAGELGANQLHGLADIASELAGGYADITTRANLQLREIKPRSLTGILTRVQELGLTSRGAGADNIRNITATPTSGFDRQELLDVRPYAKALHHYILNHRDLSGLPRKFNVAFDSGGSVSAAADTNDIGFFVVKVTASSLAASPVAAPATTLVSPGIYFRVQLGGITGHRDFARDTGLLVRPSEVVAVAAAMIRVFLENGDRTNRKKARLKYLLDKWGHEKFVEASLAKLGFPVLRLPLAACEPRHPVIKHAWIGPYRQAQRGLNALGIAIPVGRLSAKQMHRLADVAEHYGKGELRLTVWQNLLIPHIADSVLPAAIREIERIGFSTTTSAATGGIVACTGSKGCKYAAADTKGHAAATWRHLEKCRLGLDRPVNLHFTGCAHSCAQHYCGDLGFIAAKLPDGTEGFHVLVGGGMDHEQGIARELRRGVPAAEIPVLTENILRTYIAHRTRGETFVQWTRRHDLGALQTLLEGAGSEE